MKDNGTWPGRIVLLLTPILEKYLHPPIVPHTALFSLFLCFSTAYLHAQLTNGDFEAPHDTVWGIGDDDLPITTVGNPNGDGQVLLLESTTPEGQFFSQLAPLQPDSLSLYQVSFRVRTALDEEANVHLWLNVLGMEGEKMLANRYTTLTGTNNWQEQRYTFLAPSTTRQVRVGGSLAGVGRVWYDDFQLQVASLDTVTYTLSDSAEAYITEMLDTLRNRAVNRSTVDFDELGRTIRYFARRAQTTSDTYLGIHLALQQLNDNRHSRLFPADDLRRMLGGVDAREVLAKEASGESPYLTTPPLDPDSLRAELTFGEGRLLEDHVGYLALPGFTHGHYDAHRMFVDSLQRLIKDLDEQHDITGWIIDLRDDDGGATPAMIASLGPLLQPDNEAYYVDAAGKVSSGYRYQRGSYHDFVPYDSIPQDSAGPAVVTSQLNYRIKDSTLPIAVLTGPGTASAAEGLLALLLGKPNVRTFGQPTAGLTTGNELLVLSDDAGLNLATSYLATRSMDILSGPIAPNVLVDLEPGAGEDATLATALRWLATH